MRKGYVLTLDAMLALAFVMVVFLMILELQNSVESVGKMGFKRIHYASEDAIEVLNKKGVLDQVCTKWALAEGNKSSPHWVAAGDAAKQYLSEIIPERMGYKLLIGGEEICNDSRIPENEAAAKTHSTRILSGYKPGLPALGYVAGAHLSNILGRETSSYLYFGGYVGNGNITGKITLPGDANITGAFMELNAGNSFSLSVNGNPCGVYSPTAGGMRANVNETLPCSASFKEGMNVINIDFNESLDNYISGGFIRVDYETAEFDTTSDLSTYRFPGIKGIINLYSSFYVPGILNSMEIHLHYNSNNTQFLTIGNTTVFLENNTGEQTYTLNSTDIQATGLSYSTLDKKTVPIRMGTANISGIVTGNADVALITDTSFSMWDAFGRCMEGHWPMVPVGPRCPPGCTPCGASYGCDGLFGCSAGCYCPSPCGEAIPPNPYVGITCWDCRPATGNCPAWVRIDEDDMWIGWGYCNDTTDYFYFGINGTAVGCNLHICTNTSRSSCGAPLWNACDRTYVDERTGYAADGLPSIWSYKGGCVLTCVQCNLTALGLAQQLDMGFVSTVLNVSENNVGLVGYGTGIRSTHPLSNDTASLNNSIMSYRGSGETCICCAIRAAAIMLGGGDPSRHRHMLVMSDGVANSRCAAPWMATVDENADAVIDARDDAIHSARKAHNDHNITLYSVGFGWEAGSDTLQRIADCGNGSFYQSNDTDGLRDIYEEIAEKIVSTSYKAQTITITGMSVNNTLYPDSYIKLYYTPTASLEYGEVSLTFESPPFDNSITTGSFIIPNGSRPLDAMITSYSAAYWTDRLNVSSDSTSGWEKAYWLGDYGSNYLLLGDPYVVHIPSTLLSTGINNVSIATGESPTEYRGGSRDDKAIYTVAMKPSVGYGDSVAESEGCVWSVEFSDNTTAVISAPVDYSGGETCTYTNASIGYNNQSALSDAIYRLFQQLDVYPRDGRLDVKFDSKHIKVDASLVGGVRSLWGPTEVKLVVWMK